MPDKPETITAVIENDIVFMAEPIVEFVSLVKRGANRSPFKILKSEKGGNPMPSKVVQAVLMPKGLSEKAIATHLEGYRADGLVEHESYVEYTQVDKAAVDEESIEVIKMDEEDKVFGIVATLKEENEEQATVEKDSLDYATMDSLYIELYAMADIVSGAMRQSNVKAKDRSRTIMTAIENFKSFAEILLSNVKDDVAAVKLEDHPLLTHPLKKEEEPEVKETTTEEVVEEKVVDKTDTKDLADDIDAKLAELVGNLEKSILEKVQEMVDAAKEAVEQKVTASTEVLDTLKEEVETIKSTTKTSRSVKDETTEKEGDSKFGGLLFKTK